MQSWHDMFWSFSLSEANMCPAMPELEPVRPLADERLLDDLPNIAADPALLELFRAELETHLPVLSDGLLALEKGYVDEQTVAGMMRAAHSIKGAARIVGLEEAVRVAHVLEDCFLAAKEKRITLQSAAVDVLFQGVDALQKICSPQCDTAPETRTLDSLIQRIVSIRDGKATLPIEGHAATMPEPPPAVEFHSADEQLITLPSDLDDAVAEQLRARLCQAIRDQSSRICLDFTCVDRVSAQALSVLVSLVRHATGTPSLLAVRGVRGDLARLMRISGLNRAWSTDG